MAVLEIQCPHCRAKFHLPPDQAGKVVRCGACQQVFTTPVQAVASIPTARAIPAAQVAPRIRMKVTEAEAVPTPETRSSRRDDDDDYDAPRPKSKPRKPDQASKFPLIPVLAGVGGLVAVLVIVGVVLVSRPSGTTDVAKNSSPPVVPQSVSTPPQVLSDATKPINPPSATPIPAQSPPAAKNDVTPGDAIQAVKNSTVYIRTRSGNSLGMGSGFFAGPAGYVVTNSHVIGFGPDRFRKPQKIEVVVNSGENNQQVNAARIVGVNVDEDLALLWINQKDHQGVDLPRPLNFARSADLTETQEVLIFGFPLGEQLGLNISVNKSTVSSLRKENGVVVVVQVAGGMTNGNSGGPVTNTKGEVIGVSVAIIRDTPINFAIPSDKTSAFVQKQISSGGSFELGKFASQFALPKR